MAQTNEILYSHFPFGRRGSHELIDLCADSLRCHDEERTVVWWGGMARLIVHYVSEVVPVTCKIVLYSEL